MFNQRLEGIKKYRDQELGDGTLNEEEATHFYQEDAVIWIDPLDGTRAFVRGETDPPTNMICIISYLTI